MPGLTFIAQAVSLAERRFRFVARLNFSVTFRSQHRHKATPPNPSLLFSWLGNPSHLITYRAIIVNEEQNTHPRQKSEANLVGFRTHLLP